jgi:hypothetical protein
VACLKTGILPPLVELLRRAAAPVLAATLIRSGATTDPIAGDHSGGNLPPRYRQEVLNKASLPGCEFVNLGKATICFTHSRFHRVFHNVAGKICSSASRTYGIQSPPAIAWQKSIKTYHNICANPCFLKTMSA